MTTEIGRVYKMGSTVLAIIGAVIFFPHFSNKDLHQANVNYKVLGTLVVFVAYGILLIVSTFASKKRHTIIFASIGIFFISFFFYFLFVYYFPIVNRTVVNMDFSCGGNFIKGDSINSDMLKEGKTIEYDSLSRHDPKKFIEMVNCDPSIAWTFSSIEDNFNKVVCRYIVAVFLGSSGLIAIAKALDNGKTKKTAARKKKMM